LAEVFSISAEASHYEFITSADSYVYKYNPTHNAGTSVGLGVGDSYGTSPEGARIDYFERSYLRFSASDLATIAEPTILSAKIRLYCTALYSLGDATDNEIFAYRVLGNWSESTINWNNQPVTSTAIPLDGFNIDVEFSSYFFDITDLTQLWKDNPTLNYGVMFGTDLEDPNFLNEVNLQFASKENYYVASNQRPYLIIETQETPVPEPGTILLLGSLATGLFGMAAVRRRS
jgi:hypothetical protein